jgi:parallel beta-helix repeat protein
MPPRVATLFVAASDSHEKCRAQADYICDGVADEVQINAALADLPAVGGRVVLSEGRFVLADPITFPDDLITVEGQGSATEIDGDGLATGEHAFVISGRVNCQILNLYVHTQAAGGKTCHCVFAEDGADNLVIDRVNIQGSDSDGIHIEGSVSEGIHIGRCKIYGCDDHDINIVPDVGENSLKFSIYENFLSEGLSGINFGQCVGHYGHRIQNNFIFSAGRGIDYGVATVPTFGLMESVIEGNHISNCTFNGIRLRSDSDNNLIENNLIDGCGGYGINIGGATCTDNRLMNNKLIGNTTGAVQDSGTLTHTPHIFIPVPNPSTNIGTHPAELLTDELEVLSRIEFYLPEAFQELLSAHMIVVPGGTGNLRRSVAANWGGLASGETYNNATDAIAEGNVAVTADWLEAIDISAVFTGPPAISQRDCVGVAFTRHADDVLDTVGADCYLLGIMLRYV